MRRQITGLHAANRCAADQQLGQRKPDVAVFDDEILQILARRIAAGISWRSDREGVMSLMRPDPPHLRLDPTVIRDAATGSSQARWLAMPIMRHNVEPGNSLQTVSQPLRR